MLFTVDALQSTPIKLKSHQYGQADNESAAAAIVNTTGSLKPLHPVMLSSSLLFLISSLLSLVLLFVSFVSLLPLFYLNPKPLSSRCISLSFFLSICSSRPLTPYFFYIRMFVFLNYLLRDKPMFSPFIS